LIDDDDDDPAIIIGTVRSLWNWLLGTYLVPQNAFLDYIYRTATSFVTNGVKTYLFAGRYVSALERFT